MKVVRNFKLLQLIALAAISISAHAKQWTPTHTKAPRIPDAASHVAVLPNGAPISVVISLNLRNKAEFDTLTAGIASGATRPITSAEFLSRYAPTAAQVQAVVDHLTKSGFINVTVADNRLLVSAEGSHASVRNAFNTELHSYNINGRTAHANINDVVVPPSLGSIVLAVHGLQTIHQHHIFAKPMTTTAS
ncbi:MAG: protease pro-enzyme activation domain-containing protein, partial [Burkholderiaceae bacterium]